MAYWSQASRPGDVLDQFLTGAPAVANPYSSQTYYASPYRPMAAATVSPPPEYGAPGTFSGRKPSQPPGGWSSMSSLIYGGGGGGSGASNPSPSYGSGYSRNPSYGAPVYSAPSADNMQGADLSSQLNIPGAMRRPPSAGRRAISQPAAYGGYSAQTYNPPSYGASSYGSQPAYGNTPAYQTPSSNYGNYGGASYQSPTSNYSAPTQYGASAAAPSSSQYGGYTPYGSSQATSSNPYSSYPATGYGSPSAANGSSAYGYSGAAPQNYGKPPLPASPAPFVAGQKGQFGGKMIMQPPGGKTSISLFG